MVAHGLAQADGGKEVVVVVFQRHRHRFAHGLEAREVNGAVDMVLFKDAVEGRPVAHVVFVEGHLFAGDLLHALDRPGAGVDEVVDDDHAVAAVQKLHAGMAADIPGAAGDKDIHDDCSPLRLKCIYRG